MSQITIDNGYFEECLILAKQTERYRIIGLLKKIAGETCDGPVHIITSTCLCDLTALIEGKKK